MGLEFKLKVFGREFEGKPFFKRVSLNNIYKRFYKSNLRLFLFKEAYYPVIDGDSEKDYPAGMPEVEQKAC